MTLQDQAAILAEIERVQKDFSGEAFCRLAVSLKANYILVELVAWLKTLPLDKYPLVAGLLAFGWFYMGEYIPAAEMVLQVTKSFPDTEIWENLGKNAVMAEALARIAQGDHQP